MDTLELIKQKGLCCATGKPLATSRHINIIPVLDMAARWEYPSFGNVLSSEPSKAVAYVHDEALDADGVLIGPLKHVVEIRDEEFIYHDYIPDRQCIVCGCTEYNCRKCIEKDGKPCHWVSEDLCSSCITKTNSN